VMVELPWCQASVRGIEVDIPRTLTKRSQVLPLPGGEGGVRGNRVPAVLAASALDSAPEDCPKRYVTLSHSSFQAAGFARGR
jgi:hypothetical protein